MTNLMGLYLRGKGGGGLYMRRGTYIREEKHFSLQSAKRTFLGFFHVFRHFSRRTRCETCSKLRIKTPEYVNLTIKSKIKTLLTSFWSLYC